MKYTFFSIIIAVVLISGIFLLGGKKPQIESNTPVNNVSVVDGKQIIEIRAKGGYSPRVTVAKAGIPTIVRFKTDGTFDCSSFVRIPSLNVSQNLSQSGTTDIDLGTPTATTLQGMCGMGMYPFEIDFQN